MGCIASAEKFSVLVILRREFLDITGNFCAAKLIEYFRHWTKWKVKNHRTPWVYQPLKKIYADLMGEHSLHVIRAAIALLEKLGILSKQKNPGNKQDRTWQYKLNFEVLNQLLELGTGKTELGTFNTEQYHRSNPEASKPQQHAAVELKNLDEVKPEIREQAPVTHFVDEPEPDYSSTESDFHEGHSCAAGDVVQKPNDAIVSESTPVTRYVDSQQPDYSSNSKGISEGRFSAGDLQKNSDAIMSEQAPVTCYQYESELNLTDSDDVNPLLAENSHKPNKHEIKEICTELKRLRINPEPCLGVIKKYWGNVQGAIARVKDAIAQGWCENPTGLFINSCKSGAKGKNAVSSNVSAWFEWARKQRIVLAISAGVVYTEDGEAVAIEEMMRRFPVRE